MLPYSPSLSHESFQKLRLEYYRRHLFHSFLRKVYFSTLILWEKKIYRAHWYEKIKGSKRWRHVILLFRVFLSSLSLNMKVPKAQMASVLYTHSLPLRSHPAHGLNSFSTLMTPKLMSPASLQNSSLAHPVSLLTWFEQTVGTSTFTSLKLNSWNFTLPPNLLLQVFSIYINAGVPNTGHFSAPHTPRKICYQMLSVLLSKWIQNLTISHHQNFLPI